MPFAKKKKLEASLEGLFSRPEKNRRFEENDGGTPVLAKSNSLETVESEKAPSEKGRVGPVPPIGQNESLKTPCSIAEIGAKIVNDKGVGGREAQNMNKARVSSVDVPPQKVVGENGQIQVLLFRIDQNIFAVDVLHVTAIIKPQAIFEVPNSHPAIKGLINLRGQIVPVVDLKVRLSLAFTESCKDNRLIVVKYKDMDASIFVEEVKGVVSYEKKSLTPPNPFISTIETRYIDSVVNKNEQVVLLLNLEQLFKFR